MPIVFTPYLKTLAERSSTDDREDAETADQTTAVTRGRRPKRWLVLGALAAGVLAALASRRLRDRPDATDRIDQE